MSDFKLGSAEVNTSGGDDLIDMYFKMRQDIRSDWEKSGRASSLGLLSLDRTSLISHDELNRMGATFCTSTPSQNSKKNPSESSTFVAPRNANSGNFDDVFKRPKTPKKKDSLNSGMDILAAALAEAEKVSSLVRPVSTPLAEAEQAGSRVKVPLADYFTSSCSPQTPRPFTDELSSLTPDVTSSMQHPATRSSLVDFPVRDQGTLPHFLSVSHT